MEDTENFEQEPEYVYNKECDKLIVDAINSETDNIPLFLNIIKLYPECDFAYYQTGIYYKNSSKFKQAIKYLEKAISIQDSVDFYYSELGFCYEKANNLKKAVINYQKALALDSENETTRYYWADYLVFQEKDFEQAKEIMKDLIFKNPQNAIYHRFYADILSELLKIQEANEEYLKSISLDCEDEVTLNNYGTFLFNNGNTELAKEYYKRALEIAPDNELFKKNVYFVTKASTKYYKLKMKYLNRLFRPILDKPKLLFLICAILYPLIKGSLKYIFKYSAKMAENTGNIFLYKIIIVLAWIFIISLIFYALAEFITFVLIKLKIIK